MHIYIISNKDHEFLKSVCVCCVVLYVCIHIHMCPYPNVGWVCRPEVDCWTVFISFPLYILGGSHWTWNFLSLFVRNDWSERPQEPPVSAPNFQCLAYRLVYCTLLLFGLLGSKLRFPCLCSKYFTHWATSSVQAPVILMVVLFLKWPKSCTTSSSKIMTLRHPQCQGHLCSLIPINSTYF